MAAWVGLNLLVADGALTGIAFVAFVLIGVLGARFGVYAYWNGLATHVDAQVIVWGYLLLAGAGAALYGLLGVLRLVLPGVAEPLFELAGGVLLVTVLCLALALRAVYRITGLSTRTVPTTRRDRLVAGIFVAAIVVSTAGPLVLGQFRTLFGVLQGVAGFAVAVYGYRFARRRLDNVRVHGTVLDSLLRHLVPVLLVASLIPVAELGALALDRRVVLQVQIVFVVMTATTLMTATIKLRQHLAGMR